MGEVQKNQLHNYLLAFGSTVVLGAMAIGTFEFLDWAFGDSNSGVPFWGIVFFIPLAIIAVLTAGYYRSLFSHAKMTWFWWASAALNGLFTIGIILIMLTSGLGFGNSLAYQIMENALPIWTGFASLASLYNARR